MNEEPLLSPATLVPTAGLHAHLDMTLREWVQRYQNEIVFDQVRYRGVHALKNVLDLWVLQEIIWETEVEVVVEIGVRFGGTTLWLSDTLRNLRGPGAMVVAVDLASPAVTFPENVAFIAGDSIAPETLAAVSDYCRNRRTMVMVDGNHAAEHVFQELHLYSPLVSQGCYFIAEDGIVDVMEWKHATPGPLVAVHRFLAETDEFEIDRTREKFLLTYTPDGFLKRVRG
ncbi:MAG: CmcI family methyltransferase [Chthoniobacterales bacterium]